MPDTELNQLIDQVLLDTRPLRARKCGAGVCRVIYLEREASRAALLLLVNFGKEGRPEQFLGMDTRRLQHFLGHASITNTVRHTAMSPEPFKDIWRGKR